MAQVRKRNVNPLKEIDYVQIVAYALQEAFVEYFKGINANRLTSVRHIRLRSLPVDESGSFQYVRDLERRKIPKRVYLGGVPLCEIQRHPHRITWYKHAVERSEEFKSLHGKLERFFDRYIPGVERSEDGRQYIEGC